MKKYIRIENLVSCFLWLFVLVMSITTSHSIECIVGCALGLIAFIVKTIIEWKDKNDLHN